MVLAIAVCLVLSVVGGLLPFLQGWIFFVLALYLLATEFEAGRKWVTSCAPPVALPVALDRQGPHPPLGAQISPRIRRPDEAREVT